MSTEEITIDLLEEALGRGGEISLSTSGQSMMPLLQPGETFQIRRAPLNQIQVGDIVCFESGKNIMVHRVLKIGHRDHQRFFITKGDFVFQLDEPVSEDRILGRVVQIGEKRLDQPSQEALARVVAHIFYWHYRGYHMFWQMPVTEFLGRLKQRFISKRSFFMPLYMLLLWPIYRFFSNSKASRRV